MPAPRCPVKSIIASASAEVRTVLIFLACTCLLKLYQSNVNNETPMPPHLCQYNASTSYPSSFDKNNPISAVITDVKTASNNKRSVECLYDSCAFFERTGTTMTAIAYNAINTKGKCSINGCIRPATCSQAGRDNLFSKIKRNTRRQFKTNEALNK